MTGRIEAPRAGVLRVLPRTLKFRIALVVSMVALAAAVLASFAVLLPMRQQMQGIVGNHEATLLASAAAALDQEISARRVLLRSIAEAAGQPRPHDGAAAQALLEQHGVLREEFDNVVVFDPAGQVIANLADRRAVGDRSAAGGRTLLDTLAQREGTISPPFRSPLTGKPAVMLVEPVIGADGSVAAILGGGLSLLNARFMGHLQSLRPARSSYFFLLDERGTIMYHPHAARVLKNVWQEEGGATDITRRAMAGFEGWTEGMTKEGQRALVATTRLRRSGWILGVVYPVAEAYAPLRRGEQAAWVSMGVVTVLAAAIGLWLTVVLLKPLQRLQGRVERLSAGAVDIGVLDSPRADEIGSLSRAFFALSQQRQDAESRLALLTRTDTLTGLNNRRMFEAELPAALARARRVERGLALAFFDVDYFKQINDTHGHAIGDQVLCEFAQRLRSTLRKVDTVARLSGDEFVIVLELVDTPAAVEPLILKLLYAIRQPFSCGGLHLAVTATVGVAHGTGRIPAERMLKVADEALYAAKAAGRNTWELREALP